MKTNKQTFEPNISEPLITTGGNPRVKDGRFVQPEQFENNNITAEHSERCSTPVLKESVLDNTLEMENTIISPVYGRGRKKLIRDRSTTATPTPGLETNARLTTEDNPNVITVVDQNGNTDLIKAGNIEQNDNQNEQSIRKSSRLRSTNPINIYCNPITF